MHILRKEYFGMGLRGFKILILNYKKGRHISQLTPERAPHNAKPYLGFAPQPLAENITVPNSTTELSLICIAVIGWLSVTITVTGGLIPNH